MPPRIKKVKPPKLESGVINFYELPEVQVFAHKYINPMYDVNKMPLKHPMYMLICGCTGSGKSNILLNIIKFMNNTFNYIKIFTANKDEPLYQYLASKIKSPYFEIYEGMDELNNIDIDKLEKAQHLWIYDDMCLQKDQSKIETMYIRGRKLAEGCGVSNIYLSQSYFTTPTIIRKQINYLILKKINGRRDINAILKETSIDAEKEQLQAMFNHCVKSKSDITNFFLIDLGAPDEEKFRKNFDQILDVNDF